MKEHGCVYVLLFFCSSSANAISIGTHYVLYHAPQITVLLFYCSTPVLLCTYSNGSSIHPREPADDVLRIVRHDLEDRIVVHHLLNYVHHVVGQVRIFRYQVPNE